MADHRSSPGEPPPLSEVTSAPRIGRNVVIELSDHSDSNSDKVGQRTETTPQLDASASSTQDPSSQNQVLQDELLVVKVELKTYKVLHAEIKAAHTESKAARAEIKAELAAIKDEHAAMKAEHLKIQAEHKEMQAERREMKAEHKQMKAEHERMMAEHAAINAEHDPYNTSSASGLPVVDMYDGNYLPPDAIENAESPLKCSPDPYQDLPSPERSRTEFGELYVSSDDPYRAPDPYELYRPYGFGPSPIRNPVEIPNQQSSHPPASTTAGGPKSPKSFYVPFQESSSSPEALRDATNSARRKRKPSQKSSANNTNLASADSTKVEHEVVDDDDAEEPEVVLARLLEGPETAIKSLASSRPSPAIPPEFGLDKFYDTVCVTNWREQLDKSEEKDKASLLPSLIMVEHTAIAIHYRLVMESNKRRANFLNRFPEIAAKPRDQLTSSDLENLNIIKRNEIEHAESKPTPDPDIIPKMKEVARYSGAEIEWMNHERREEAFTRLAAGESLDDMI